MTSILVVAAAAAASALLVPWLRNLALRRALLDHPNDRSSHAVPKPRLGGVGVLVPVLVAGGWLVAAGRAPPSLLVPLGAVAVIALVGLADDLRPLPARFRLVVHLVLAALVVVASWERLPAAAGTLGAFLPRAVLAPLAVLWIAWLTNLYNFMDGIDGLAGLQALTASLALAAVAHGLGAGATQVVLLALAGASMGFLAYNLPPSSIFLGDVGSTATGFLFGVLPLLPEARPVPVEPVVLAVSLFVLDATWTLVRRIRAGERLAVPHRSHLYQRPVVAGATHADVLRVAGAGMVMVGVCAVIWPVSGLLARAMLAAVPVALFVAGNLWVRRVEHCK